MLFLSMLENSDDCLIWSSYLLSDLKFDLDLLLIFDSKILFLNTWFPLVPSLCITVLRRGSPNFCAKGGVWNSFWLCLEYFLFNSKSILFFSISYSSDPSDPGVLGTNSLMLFSESDYLRNDFLKLFIWVCLVELKEPVLSFLGLELIMVDLIPKFYFWSTKGYGVLVLLAIKLTNSL